MLVLTNRGDGANTSTKRQRVNGFRGSEQLVGYNEGNALGDGDDPEDYAAQGLRARILWSAGFIRSFGIQVIWAF